MLELVTVRVSVALPGGELAAPPAGEAEEPRTRQALFAGERMEARGASPAASATCAGPRSASWPRPRWWCRPAGAAATDDDGTIVLEREG